MQSLRGDLPERGFEIPLDPTQADAYVGIHTPYPQIYMLQPQDVAASVQHMHGAYMEVRGISSQAEQARTYVFLRLQRGCSVPLGSLEVFPALVSTTRLIRTDLQKNLPVTVYHDNEVAEPSFFLTTVLGYAYEACAQTQEGRQLIGFYTAAAQIGRQLAAEYAQHTHREMKLRADIAETLTGTRKPILHALLQAYVANPVGLKQILDGLVEPHEFFRSDDDVSPGEMDQLRAYLVFILSPIMQNVLQPLPERIVTAMQKICDFYVPLVETDLNTRHAQGIFRFPFEWTNQENVRTSKLRRRELYQEVTEALLRQI